MLNRFKQGTYSVNETAHLIVKLNKKTYDGVIEYYTRLIALLRAEEFDGDEADKLIKLRKQLERRAIVFAFDKESAENLHDDFKCRLRHQFSEISEIVFSELVVPYSRDKRVQAIWDFFSAPDLSRERRLLVHRSKWVEIASGVERMTIIANNNLLLERLFEGTLPDGVEIRFVT